MEAVRISLSLLPVLFFLSALILLDTFKLVSLRLVLFSIVIGTIAAGVAVLINEFLISHLDLTTVNYSRYVAPIVEEMTKCLFLVYLIRKAYTGFIVDAAILGFAVGTGFAIVENIYYLMTLHNSNLVLWAIRGFGTASMHGGTIAVFAIISKNLTDRYDSMSINYFIPGYLLAVFIHMVFNFFILPPAVMTLVLLIVFPLIIMIAFKQSEKATEKWLGVGMDNDIEIIELITSGKMSESNVGKYLESLRNKFSGEILADILCYLHLYKELGIQAKGQILLQEQGVKLPPDELLQSKLTELKYLEKSIGQIGRLAILPFLKSSSQDIWQVYYLQKK